MGRFREHKFHLISTVVVFGLFLFSVFIRQEKLSLRMSPQEEWLTAHTLITLQIWDQGGGPANYHFGPVYSYSGKGNKRIASLGGVMDEQGDMYYVSYPPFAFIFAYYSTKLLGGPDLASIRVVSLLIHLLCTLLIYLIIRSLSGKGSDWFSIAALLGSILYLFSSGTLWLHSVLYFADTLVQLFIVAAIYLYIRLVKGTYQKQGYLLFWVGLVTFLGVYTEWLALFFAFFSGGLLFVLFMIKRKKILLQGFLVIGISSVLSLGTTVAQFASIAGFETLMEVSQSKFTERSGYQESIDDTIIFNWENPASYEILERNLNRNFAMAVNLFALSLILLIPFLIWKKTRKKMTQFKWKIGVLSLLLVSILSHYILFYNFNSIHNFSNLKTGFFMILSIALVVSMIEESISWQIRIGLTLILLFLVLPRGIRDYKRYENFYSESEFSPGREHSAQCMRRYKDPDTYAFTNLPVRPSYMYQARHIPFQIADSSDLPLFMEYFNINCAQYYHHKNDDLQSILEVELIKGQLFTTGRIDF